MPNSKEKILQNLKNCHKLEKKKMQEKFGNLLISHAKNARFDWWVAEKQQSFQLTERKYVNIYHVLNIN